MYKYIYFLKYQNKILNNNNNNILLLNQLLNN